MQAHALVLLLVLGLVAPVGQVAGQQTAATADTLFAQGRQLLRRGDNASAQAFFAQLADQLSPDLAASAQVLEARAALADGDSDGAEAILQHVLAANPGPTAAAQAYFGLEQVRRAAGDCAGALRALGAYESIVGAAAVGPYTSLQRAQCAAKLGDWPAELDAARLALAIDGGGPRLSRIEALERAAEASTKLGRKQDALDYYSQSLQLAGTRAYRAEMLYTTAAVARSLGQTALAIDHFRSVVVDYPEQARGPDALDALSDMGRDGSVSPYQAGLVRLAAKDESRALWQFEQVEPGSQDWGPAQLGRAEALLKLGRDDDARQGLQAVADSDPAHAASALLRLGQLDERDGDNEAAAEAHYLAMAQAAPDRAAEALFHVGFTRYARQDTAGAQAAFRQGLASGGPPAPIVQAELDYWLAKTLPNGSAEANAALGAAAVAAPDSYYSLRAQDALNTTQRAASSAPSPSASWLAPSAQELQERSDWFVAQGTTAERASSEVAATEGIRRVAQLLDLGLRTEASWEIDGLLQQYAQAHDLVHLSALADWLAANDLPQLELQVGKQERDLAGYTNLPRFIQKQVYPAGWGDLVQEAAGRYSLDPLLLLAVIRQESSFDPRAQSGAQARGLTQVVPSTASSIAARLGYTDFSQRDLFKPALSLDFGAWFLGQLLGDYKGQVVPTLAAYNAGGGNVARWLNRFSNDPDLLVEQIPLNETQTYVRIVVDNYWHYQTLYAGP